MLKLIGCGGILAGAAGLFLEWKRQEKKQILQLEELEHFLRKGTFSIEKECKQSRIFFREYIEWDVRSPILQEVLQELERNLDTNTFSTGEKAWQAAWEKYKSQWKPREEEWQVILSVGEGFFGRDRREMASQMKVYEERIRQLKQEHKSQMMEKGKIYMPLSISGGFFIILLLI